ncbi:hypothetical protein PvNV_019 [Penaeus vannamei nudivirus]|nr:hypothetical protein PvSNPV_019 [Penaeus vannamei nucleopolyhedrovirus]
MRDDAHYIDFKSTRKNNILLVISFIIIFIAMFWVGYYLANGRMLELGEGAMFDNISTSGSIGGGDDDGEGTPPTRRITTLPQKYNSVKNGSSSKKMFN